MPNCYEKIITISPKLATLASGQNLLMNHTQTQRQPTYMADFILPCNKLAPCSEVGFQVSGSALIIATFVHRIGTNV